MRNDDELICFTCDGAGLVPDGCRTYKVKVCESCNGIGVVIVQDKKVIKFDVDKKTLDFYAYVNGMVNDGQRRVN